VHYPDLPSLRAASGQEQHGIRFDHNTCFTTFNVPGQSPTSTPAQLMTLNPGCAAVDAGVILPNINDGFLGSAPDLGPYESGAPLPIYGPRPLNSDTTPPTVAITAPLSGASVFGAVPVAGTAADNVALARVEVLVDSGAPQTASGTILWSLTLNTLGCRTVRTPLRPGPSTPPAT